MGVCILKRPDATGWTVQFEHPDRPTRIRWKGGRTKSMAQDRARRVEEALAKGHALDQIKRDVFGVCGASDGDQTVAWAIDYYRAHGAKRKRATTVDRDRSRYERLKAWEWGTWPVGRVTDADVVRYVEARQATGVSIATVQRELSALSAVYRFLLRKRVVRLEGNPVQDARALWQDEWSEAEPDAAVYLSEKEASALLATAREKFPTVYPIVATALHTLARQGELLRLEWRDVDLDGGTLTVRPESAKNGKSRVVPLNSAVRAVLEGLNASRAVRALDKRDGVFPLTRWTLRTEWDALKQATGLRLRFHDLRHSGASLFAQAGMPAQELMRIGGWRSWSMVERYTRRAPRQSATELLAHIAAV